MYWYSVISSPCSGIFPSPSAAVAAALAVASPRRPEEDHSEGARTRGEGGEGVLLLSLLMSLLLSMLLPAAEEEEGAEAEEDVERARCSWRVCVDGGVR